MVFQAAAAVGNRHVARFLLKGTSASTDIEARLGESIGSKFFVSAMQGTLPPLADLTSLFCKYRTFMSGEAVVLSLDEIAGDEGPTLAFLSFLVNGFSAFGIDASSLLPFPGKLAQICGMMPSSQAQRLRAAVMHKTLVDSMASLQVEWFIFTGSPTSGDSDRLRRPPPLHVDGSQLALAANAVTQVVYDRHLRQFITPLVEPGPTPLEPIPKRPKSSHPETQHSGGKGKGKGKGGRAVQLASPSSLGGRGGGGAVASSSSEVGAKRDRTLGCKVVGDKVIWGPATYNWTTACADFKSQFPLVANPDPVALCCEAASESAYIRKLAPGTSLSDVAAYVSWWRSWSIRKHRPDFA